MSSNLRFLIVTPTLNPGPWLIETLESIAQQTYPYWQHWIVDGGTVGTGWEHIQQWTRRFQVHVERVPGLKQAAAINRGWQQGQGEILSWLNADDLLLPDALAQVARVFQTQPEVDVVYGRTFFINASGQVLGEYPVQPFDRLRLFLRAEDYLAQPATFVRRRALDKYGMLREDLDYVMDYELWLRLAAQGLQFKFLDIPLAQMRLHLQAKTLRHTAEFAPELVRVFRDLERSGLPPEIRTRRREMWGWVYYQSARYSFWGGRPNRARYYLLKALQHWPKHLQRRNTWLLLGLVFFGKPGWYLARKVYGHPWMKAYVPLH